MRTSDKNEAKLGELLIKKRAASLLYSTFVLTLSLPGLAMGVLVLFVAIHFLIYPAELAKEKGPDPQALQIMVGLVVWGIALLVLFLVKFLNS